MPDAVRTKPRGPLVILAQEDDPYAALVRVAAEKHVGSVWQPRALDDVAWGVDPQGDADPTLIDRASGQRWQSGDLRGVWFQSYPTLRSARDLDTRTRSYVSAEIAASLACFREEARCTTVGLPPIDLPILLSGIQARVEMRRVGITVLADELVANSGQSNAAPQSDPSADRQWLIRSGGTSGWAADRSMSAGAEGSTTWASTLLDDRRVLAVVWIGSQVRTVQMDGSDLLIVNAHDLSDVVSAALTLTRMSQSPVGVTLFARQSGRWLVSRHSLHVPYWLFASLESWICDPLLELFAGR